MTISTTITAMPDAPSRTDPDNFRTKADAWISQFTDTTVDEFNSMISEINSTQTEFNAMAAGAFTATSSSSVAIGTGSKTFVLDSGYKAFGEGVFLRIVDDANHSNYMKGTITSYTSSTNTVVVNVTETGGSGTISAWNIAVTVSGNDSDTVDGYDASNVATANTLLTLNADSKLPADILQSYHGTYLLDTASVSTSVAAVDFTTGIDSTYEEYILKGRNVKSSGATSLLYLRTSADGGSTFDSGEDNYSWHLSSSSVTTTDSDTEIQMSNFSIPRDTANHLGASFELHILNPSAAERTAFWWIANNFQDETATSVCVAVQGAGLRHAAEAIDGIRILLSAGNIESGEFYLYGVKTS